MPVCQAVLPGKDGRIQDGSPVQLVLVDQQDIKLGNLYRIIVEKETSHWVTDFAARAWWPALVTFNFIQNRVDLLLGQPLQHHLRFLQILCDTEASAVNTCQRFLGRDEAIGCGGGKT